MKTKVQTKMLVKIKYILFLSGLLLCIMAGCFYFETKTLYDFVDKEENALSFDQTEGRYASDLTVSIKKEHLYPFLTTIRYTLDGSEPTEESTLYEGPISLKANEKTAVYSIRCAAFYKGEHSQIQTATYMVGTDVMARYALPVLSVTGDENDFFGDEAGLLVPGNLYQEYVENGGEEEASWNTPANFNQLDWTKDVYLSFFDSLGNKVFGQDSTLCITGNSSRKYAIKPLKFTAEEGERFQYDFGWEEEASHLPHVSVYKKLKLRNDGIDFPETMLRGTLTSKLAKQTGFHDIAPVSPVAVYINNKYYGMEDMQPVYTGTYLANLYDLDQDKIEVIDGGEEEFLKALGYGEDWDMDANDDSVRKEFEEKVDIDELLQYYAFELITGNADWPLNNIKMWRYQGEYQKENSYTDGRGRFLLFDFDSTFECMTTNEDPFAKLFYQMYGNKEGQEDEGGDETGELWDLLPNLLKYKEYRTKFVNILMDDVNSSLSAENMNRVLEECEKITGQELAYSAVESPYEEVKEQLEDRNENVSRLRDVISKRPEQVYSYINQYFDGETTYRLSIQKPEEGNIIETGSLRAYGGENGTGISTTRCAQYESTIRPILGNGQKFSYWIVNGTKVMEETLVLKENDGFTKQDEVSVQLVTVQDQNGKPIISEVSEKGDTDFIELYNPTQNAINLSEYFLSDDPDDLIKYQCPVYILKPGEVIWINGKGNPILNEYIMNFNLKGGETIYLTKNEEISCCDSLYIPNLSENESYGRYLETSEYRYFLPSSGGTKN